MRERSKQVSRAIQTARECATCDPGMADIKLRRFHRAMDALGPGEGEDVYDVLREEGWYRMAAAALSHGSSPQTATPGSVSSLGEGEAAE